MISPAAVIRRPAPKEWRGLFVVVGVAFIVLCLPRPASCVIFDLVDRGERPAGQASHPVGTKCVSEDINKGVLVLGDFSSVDGSKIDVKFRGLPVTPVAQVEDPSGALLYTANAVTSGQFAFSTSMKGDFKACFSAAGEQGTGPDPQHMRIRLDWKTGIAATDWDAIAKKDNLDAMGTQLRELEAQIQLLHEGLLYMRNREAELRNLNEATNGRVAWLSITSLLVCVALAVWQIFYLKSFFERKKLL